LSALLSKRALTEGLLDAIERDLVALAELDATDRDALRLTADPALRARAEQLLGKSKTPDRSAVVRSFEPSLALTGDPRRGADLFQKNCQTCHMRQGKGNRVGPDLSGVGGRPSSALLNDILDPTREVAPDFVSFLLVTRQGQVVSGILAEETGTSLKLRGAEGAEQTVLRSEVDVFRPSGRSLMPEGLEQTFGAQGLADLIAFLRQP
jgi:putative heme-binding domain-containing protein